MVKMASFKDWLMKIYITMVVTKYLKLLPVYSCFAYVPYRYVYIHTHTHT